MKVLERSRTGFGVLVGFGFGFAKPRVGSGTFQNQSKVLDVPNRSVAGENRHFLFRTRQYQLPPDVGGAKLYEWQ